MSEQQQSVTSEIVGDLFVDFNLISTINNNNPKPNYEKLKLEAEVRNSEKILPPKKNDRKSSFDFKDSSNQVSDFW